MPKGRGRPPKSPRAKSTIATGGKKICNECKKEKNSKEYYITNNKLSADGLTEICKDCLLKHINYYDMNTIYHTLQLMDLPFFFDMWELAVKNKPEAPFRSYITMANSHRGKFRIGQTYQDSEFTPKRPPEKTLSASQILNLVDLKDKWGHGYTEQEYFAFERKYVFLTANYKEKTAMHTEALYNYIRYRVKEEMATAAGEVTSAKSWGQLAREAATQAKINPSQMSAADLLDGVSCFGQLVKAVEETVDIIPLLPKFIEQPQDKVDFTLWCYINYIRELKGYPRCEYSEIYEFYQQMLEEYEKNKNSPVVDSTEEIETGDDE
jgi:hypothetical protein